MNGTSRMSVLFCMMTLLYISARFVVYDQNEKIAKLEHQVSWYKTESTSMATNTSIALKLRGTSVWYVVDEKTVSSKPNGKGEIVKFAGEDKLRSMGSHSYIWHVDYNKKVIFYLPSITTDGYKSTGFYSIAGRLLDYQLK